MLRRYYFDERMAKVTEVKALAFVMAGQAGKAEGYLKDLVRLLLPELGEVTEDFRKVAEKSLKTWRDRVISLEGTPSADGRHTAYSAFSFKNEDVQEELEAFAQAQKALRASEKKKPGVPPPVTHARSSRRW